MADLLPEDTLYNIFSRIPSKSLARFRCVCKQWREYINDPHLANIHHVKDEPKPMLIGLIKYLPKTSVLSFLQVTEDNTDGIQVKKDCSSRLIYQPFYHKILGYCNGLIALLQRHHRYDIGDTFVVINPLTKECHELPPMKKPRRIWEALGFDSSTNTFKMVCSVYDVKQGLNLTLVHVLGTDSWREIPQVSLYHIHGEAVYANGRLYWFAKRTSCRASQEEKLVWFDMKKEEFGVIDLPAKQTQGWYHRYYTRLVDLNGELGFVDHHNRDNDREVVVWILKHDDQWIIHCKQPDYCYGSLRVLGYWNQDGDLLMSTSEGLSFCVYRLKSDSFDRLIIPEDDLYEEQVEVRMHQSSLFSIRKWH